MIVFEIEIFLSKGGVYCPPENLEHWEVAQTTKHMYIYTYFNIHIYMYIFTHIYIHMCKWPYIHPSAPYVYAHAAIYICAYIICKHICTYTFLSCFANFAVISWPISMSSRQHPHIAPYVYIYIYVYIHIHIVYMYTFIHPNVYQVVHTWQWSCGLSFSSKQRSHIEPYVYIIYIYSHVVYI